MKKNKKLTGQQVKFIINMLSLAVFAFSYLYIYNSFVNKKEDTYQEIDLINKYIQTTEDKAAKKDEILKETEAVKSQIQGILDSYPVDLKSTDNLMFVAQMGKELGITFSSVSASDSTSFFSTTVPAKNADGTAVAAPAANASDTSATMATDSTTSETGSNDTGSKSQTDALDDIDAAVAADTNANTASNTSGDAAGTGAATMTGLQSTITMSFQTTAEGFTKLVDYINNYPSRTVIDSVSITVDSTTNMLTGTLVIKRYALSGTGKVYTDPVVDGISIGTDNLFGIGPDKTEEPTPTESPDEAAQENP